MAKSFTSAIRILGDLLSLGLLAACGGVGGGAGRITGLQSSGSSVDTRCACCLCDPVQSHRALGSCRPCGRRSTG